MTYANIWTNDRVEQLQKLYAEGYSCAQIAAEIGLATRNSVIGKIHRMGLNRPANWKPKPSAPRAPRQHGQPRERKARLHIVAGNNNRRIIPAFETAEQVELRAADVIPLNLSLLDMQANQCRYPYDNPTPEDGWTHKFCGHATLQKSSYCFEHERLCTGHGTASERAATRVQAKLLVCA